MTKPSSEESDKTEEGVRASRERRVRMKRVMEEEAGAAAGLGGGVEAVRGWEHRAAAGGMFR